MPRGSSSEGAEPTGEGTQEAYLADIDVPHGYIRSPGETVFANATWMHVGPEIRKLVAEVMRFEEFNDIRGVPFQAVWRRRSKPMRGFEPIFSSVELVQPRVIWEANQMEMPDFPRYFLDFHWSHFNDLREGLEPGQKHDPDENPENRSPQFVHEKTLQQHIHHALSHLSIENDILGKRSPDFSGFAETVKRYGLWNNGIVVVRRQMSLWPNPDE